MFAGGPTILYSQFRNAVETFIFVTRLMHTEFMGRLTRVTQDVTALIISSCACMMDAQQSNTVISLVRSGLHNSSNSFFGYNGAC